MSSEVVLLDFCYSPFSMRVKIALAEKGVSYEAKEEDLFGGKSTLLLKSNPIYEKVPVLLHNAKPVVESTNIVYYIDETWADSTVQLLPSCSYERSKARFWADFIDRKVLHPFSITTFTLYYSETDTTIVTISKVVNITNSFLILSLNTFFYISSLL